MHTPGERIAAHRAEALEILGRYGVGNARVCSAGPQLYVIVERRLSRSDRSELELELGILLNLFVAVLCDPVEEFYKFGALLDAEAQPL